MNSIFERISIRVFEEREVEEWKIIEILKAAMAAPSAQNQQPWEFYVVTNREKIEALSKCSPYAGCAAGAPVVLVPCCRVSDLVSPRFQLEDLSAATENMLLEITALGLGGVWLGVAPAEERMSAAREVLGLGEDMYAFAFIPVGYPGEHRSPENRFDSDRIHYIP